MGRPKGSKNKPKVSPGGAGKPTPAARARAPRRDLQPADYARINEQVAAMNSNAKAAPGSSTHIDTVRARIDASNGAELRKPVDAGRVVRELRCKPDEDELVELQTALAAVTCERVQLEADKASLVEEINKRKARETFVAGQIRDGILRDVECIERLTVETNAVDLVRLDTGEVVETRTATPQDRQTDMFGKGVAPAPGTLNGPAEVREGA